MRREKAPSIGMNKLLDKHRIIFFLSSKIPSENNYLFGDAFLIFSCPFKNNLFNFCVGAYIYFEKVRKKKKKSIVSKNLA